MSRKLRLRIAMEPHCNKQALIFNSLFIPDMLEMYVACGTKFGKTISASSAMTLALPIAPQSLYRWVAPIYSQAKIGFKYIRRMLPPEPHTKVNESALTLRMPHNDSMIQFFHGQNPESLEGEATQGNILDEAAKMKEEVYASVKTTTSVTAGPIIAISTPRGKNSWFYRKCMEAKEEMIRARHEGRRPTKLFIHAPTWANPTVSQAVLDDAKKTLPNRLWLQYYAAEFVSDGSCFTGYDRCWNTDYIDMGEQFTWLYEGAENHRVVIGVDWARNVDYTVMIASSIDTREIVGIVRLRGLGYPMQIKRLKAFASNFKDCEIIWHDKTGVGVALDDMLHETELPVKGIVFSNASKNEMMVNLMVAFEERSYRIPHINVLANELSDLEVKTSATGLPTYGAADGATDDMIMSMGLSHAAMLQYLDRDYSVILS